jgi:hypothetical protein
MIARAHKIAVVIVFAVLTAWILVGSWQPLRHQAGTRLPHWDWLTHDAVGFFTLGLVIVGSVQVGLFFWQLLLIKATLGPAEAAAKAADLNAQAVINAQRARLYVIIESQTIGDEVKAAVAPRLPPLADDVRLEHLTIEYSFRNHGKTPAFIQKVGHGTAITKGEGEPKGRHYILLVPPVIDYVVGGGEKTVPIRNVAMPSPSMTVATAKAIRGLDATFWFHGFVEYDDTFGWSRKFEFVWYYDAESEGLRLFSYCETAEPRSPAAP